VTFLLHNTIKPSIRFSANQYNLLSNGPTLKIFGTPIEVEKLINKFSTEKNVWAP